MARPRKLVRDPRDSKVIFGLSINKSTGEHYSIGEDGKRVYWGRDRRQAIDAFHASARPALADNAFVVINPPRVGVSVEHNKWVDVSRYSHALDKLATVLTPEQVEHMRPVVDHMIRWGESFGFPYQFTNVTGFEGLRKRREQELAAERTGRAVLGNRSDGKPSRERLSDCLRCWDQWKSSEGRSRAFGVLRIPVPIHQRDRLRRTPKAARAGVGGGADWSRRPGQSVRRQALARTAI